MSKLIDFTECPIDKTANYGGSEQKRGILYRNRRYMLKLSERTPEQKRNSLNSSYSNSAFSEYICCKILKAFEFDVQNVLLGTITQVSARTGEIKVSPAVACENFVQEGYELIEFKAIEGSLLLGRPPKIPRIDDIYEVLSSDNEYFPTEKSRSLALRRYWDTFIVDALFGNFDRHANNWGYLVNKETKELTLAPIYDCGSCLYPQISDEAIPGILSNEKEIEKRVFMFPTACLEINGEKISYHEYINSLKNDDCTKALFRVYPVIDFVVIDSIIERTDGLSEVRKKFYKTMLRERYDRILTPAYIKAKSLFVTESSKNKSRTQPHPEITDVKAFELFDKVRNN